VGEFFSIPLTHWKYLQLISNILGIIHNPSASRSAVLPAMNVSQLPIMRMEEGE
jgi:hypothetical protein